MSNVYLMYDVCIYAFANRCAEKSYQPKYFHHRVSRYRIDDFNPPPIEMMKDFCEDVDRWLSQHPKNVIAVHCHAGKVCRPITSARILIAIQNVNHYKPMSENQLMNIT